MRNLLTTIPGQDAHALVEEELHRLIAVFKRKDAPEGLKTPARVLAKMVHQLTPEFFIDRSVALRRMATRSLRENKRQLDKNHLLEARKRKLDLEKVKNQLSPQNVAIVQMCIGKFEKYLSKAQSNPNHAVGDGMLDPLTFLKYTNHIMQQSLTWEAPVMPKRAA